MVKQCLSRTEKFYVIPQDLDFIMIFLQCAIEKANESDNCVIIVPTTTKVGQKQDHCLYLGFLKTEKIESMSLHMACSIIPMDPDIHLFWSQYGLHSLVDPSRNMYSVLGMHKTVNVETDT